jgi:hypothetical protein
MKRFVFLTRPDGTPIAVDPYFVTAVRLPLKNEGGKCVLEPSRQQVLETFDATVKMLGGDDGEANA